MSDPMSERELSAARDDITSKWNCCCQRGTCAALLAEIDRLRELMKEAADALEHYGRNSSLECYCCQHSVGHSEGCIVMRLRTAGEG